METSQTNNGSDRIDNFISVKFPMGLLKVLIYIFAMLIIISLLLLLVMTINNADYSDFAFGRTALYVSAVGYLSSCIMHTIFKAAILYIEKNRA